MEQLYKEQLAIFEAKAQDEEEARTKMLIHLKNVGGILRKYFSHT